jgi:hypothetical protein
VSRDVNGARDLYPRLKDAAWLRRRYVDAGLSTGRIAGEVGCSAQAVRMALAAAGIARRQPRTRRRYPSWPTRIGRGDPLDEDASAVTIATELGCTDATVRGALVRRRHLPGRSKTRRWTLPVAGRPAWLRQRHVLDGVRADDIAAELGCDPSTVRAALRAAGIPRLGWGSTRLQLADHEWLRRRYLQDGASMGDRRGTGLRRQGGPARPRGG